MNRPTTKHHRPAAPLPRRPRRRVGALLVAAATLAGAPPLAAQVSDLQKATAVVKPAVVYIKTEFWSHVAYGGQIYGPVYTGAVGSGFFIHPDGFVLTNAHVVEPTPDVAQSIKVNFALLVLQELERQPSEAEVYKIAGNAVLVEPHEGLPIKPSEIERQVSVVTKGGVQQVAELQREFKAEVRALSPMMQKDIAILKIEGSNFPTVSLGDSDRVQLQDQVTVIGYPGVVQSTFERTGLFSGESQMEVSLTQGIVSSFKTWHDGSRILGTDANSAHGNSGGPAVDPRGEVIGILSMGAVSETGGTTGFNFLRPINVAKDFVRAQGIVPEVSLTEKRYVDGLEAFWRAQEAQATGDAGEAREAYEAAKTSFQGTLNLYPQHPDAQSYLVRAEEALSQLPRGGALPLVPVLVVLALVAVAAVLFFTLRGRKTAPAVAATPGAAVAGAAAIPAAGAHPAPAPATPPAAPVAPGGGHYTLEAESGPLAGSRFDVGPDGLLIGRDPGRCQVVYQADTVSREHARIQRTHDGLVVTNLSSTNQTYVNDRPISQATVQPGDRIRVSQVVFLVRG